MYILRHLFLRFSSEPKGVAATGGETRLGALVNVLKTVYHCSLCVVASTMVDIAKDLKGAESSIPSQQQLEEEEKSHAAEVGAKPAGCFCLCATRLWV